MKKNILLYSLFLISLVALLPGCEKEKDKEEPIAGSKPSIEVTISPETVNQGGSSTLVYKISDASTMSINGESITKMIDTLILNNLQTDKVFNFEAENDYGTTTIIKKITVIPLQSNLPSLRTLTADPPIMPIGGGITTISWTSNENTTSVEFDGISYPANGSLPVNVINDSTTLVFVAKGPEGQRASSILIEVEEEEEIIPIPIEHQYLNYAGWRILKIEVNHPTINPDEWEEIDNSAPCFQDDRLYFNLEPQTMVIDKGVFCPGENSNFTCNWSLDGNILVGLAPTRTITTLNWDTLIWTYDSVYTIFNPDGSMTQFPEIVRVIYVH